MGGRRCWPRARLGPWRTATRRTRRRSRARATPDRRLAELELVQLAPREFRARKPTSSAPANGWNWRMSWSSDIESDGADFARERRCRKWAAVVEWSMARHGMHVHGGPHCVPELADVALHRGASSALARFRTSCASLVLRAAIVLYLGCGVLWLCR